MTAEQAIKRQILIDYRKNDESGWPQVIVEGEIDQLYEEMEARDDHWDLVSEFRGSGIETDLQTEWSRHYETKSVGTQLDDGSWVGWTYWYGGGKYGQPESMDWMSEAYFLEVKEEEKVLTVRTFTVKE